MTRLETFCPLRQDKAGQDKKCDDNCERYVKLEIADLAFEGCADHVQARMLGLIAGKLAVIASEMK